MPGIQDIDIEVCRRLSSSGDGHPTETLLRIWGSKGYSIMDLYKIFLRAKLIRCMQILLPFGIICLFQNLNFTSVDKQYHKYADIVEDSHPMFQQQQSPSMKKSLNLSRPTIHQTVAKKSSIGVYSRKG